MNSEFFSFGRFGRYFVTDLKRGIDNYGPSLLFLSLGGLISYIIIGVVFLMLGNGWCHISYVGRTLISLGFMAALFVTVGTKLYGYITDKSRGAAFISLPVSTFEKTLSILIISLIVVPCVFFSLYLCTDYLLTVFDKSMGESLAGTNFVDKLLSFSTGGTEATIATRGLVFVQSMFNIMIFLLGALFFRRQKIAKTIIVVMAVSIVSSIVMSVLGIGQGLENSIPQTGDIPAAVADVVSGTLKKAMILEVCLIIVGSVATYFRIKTIKY